MKTLQTLLNGFRKALPTALMLCAGIAANAQVRIPFTQRTSAFSPTQTIYSINGDFTMIGNTNMTLQNYGATINNSNNTMVKVDNDGISSTNNSSSSTLTFSNENGANPNCSRILFAGLYWTGRTDATPSELQKRTVKFRGPGQADYTTYTATPSNIRYPGDDNMYAAFVEVTSQVQQRGLGEYWAADMALTTGNGGSTGYYGGWGLVVVYENSKMKKRDVTLFDGYAYVVGGTAQWELPVSGFTSALSGAVNTKLGMMAGEGDVTITGDKFEIQKLTSTNWELLSHGGNSATNFFNGSIFTGGNSRNPNLVNNTGMDISMFNIPNASNSVIGNGQTSTKFRYSSTQDTYIIYSICMAVDAYEPVVEGFLSTLSVNNIPTTTSNITVLPGDEIKYKVQIRNKGNEAVNNARIEIPLPYAAITYQGSTVNVFAPASSSALPYVDASLGANGTLVWDFGTLPLPSDPNTVLGEIIFTLKASEDCELYRNFNCAAPSVQIDGNISGVGANTQISVDDQPFYVGFSNVDGCSTEPLLGPFNIDINSASWVTANCPATDGVRDFTYCNRTVAIPVTDVLGFYPAGTRFFNANQTVEYTVANPFPNQAGPITYRALLPGSSCVLSFTISITNISSVPTVAGGTTEYCRNDAAVALSATPSNPSYQLFYFAPSSTIAQPLLIPSTTAAGNFVYQVAEGPSSTCISTARANIPVQVNALPTITATPTQIVCFGGTGSVELAANGGTGALTFNASNPSTSNLSAGSYTYEVSDSKGCDASATAAINAAPAQPAQPSLACYQIATWNVTTCSWDVTGTQAPAPTTACYETATFNTLTCGWDVTGTQPPAPTTACYETATFNTLTCGWDVTGTQAPAPTTACYETATFNTLTCGWDVTGTQAPAPTTACYEIATFNTSTCGWDVTGTQPPAPTTACYETATFNTSTCGWDVTGTQAPAPTTACYETATFNTLTCGWDVTGTQPPAPTTACYETATFNTLTCGWDVTGTQEPQPTGLACWQTATFNTTSCSWVVSGTPAPAIVTNASACGSYTWTVNNQQYTASGSYTFAENCQDYTLNLTVTPAVNDTLVVSACDNYNWNGNVYTQSGTYTLSANCDNACSEVQTSPYSCSGSGYTSTISTNSDVNVGPGQTVRISAASFNKNLNISGGTLVICGSAAPQNINMNTNGAAFTMVVNGSLLLNNLNLPTNTVIKNYGSLTLNNSVGFSGEIQNYGSMTCSADFNVNSGGKFYNYATASVNNHNNSNISENRGTLAIGNRLQNNGGASFKNTCTLNVGNEFINNSSVVNEGSVVIQQMLRLNGGSTFENAAGKTVSTKNLILDGTFRGVGSGLSRLSVSMSSLINASGRLEGTTSLCDVNGVETNNGQAIAPAFIGCSGNVSAASCCNTSTLVLTIAPSTSNTTTVSACESYTWAANGTTYTSSGIYSKVIGCNTEILNLSITPKPSQPSIACYQTATFNTATCSWDVTGTQEPAPTNLSCWQTATFNTTSCDWDVTGTQAPAPTTACYETATFNTLTCGWDVTGTQPAQPTGLACWQSANFNTTSCSWDVTGTQAPAPTNLSCWQTATFNTTSCSWDVSGTQPAQPTNLACWQSANFNTATCSWVVSGTQPAQPGTPVSLASSFDISSLPGYGVATSALFNFNAAGGWAGWSVPAGKVVLGAKIISAGDNFSDFAVFRPASPGQSFPHYTYGANEYGWVMQAKTGQSNNGVQIEVYYADAPSNYAITQSVQLNYNGAGGYGGWSAPAGDIVSGGGYQFNNSYSSAAISALAVAGSSWPSGTISAGEQAWIVRGPSNNLQNPGRIFVVSFTAPANQNCWDNYVFNNLTCQWVNLGSQPPAPTNLACWQSANFNTTSCSWDVTGTQAPAPTNLSCWQTATFNTTSCAWDVTGTQAPAPTNLSCWQTATFNTGTCSWDVTGTQAPAPTNLSCWQTATFNTTTCGWDVTGTQPAQPTNLACYQTATFNTASCSWVVSGTPAPAIVTNASACGSYTWAVNSQLYTASGTYNFSVNCQNYTLVLNITPITSSTAPITACGSYTWPVNGQTYTQSGTYTFLDGCVNRTLQLTISGATTAGQITGPANSCAHQGTSGTNATYSVQATNATSYVWTLPSGATNISGQGTASISFRYASSFSNGAVSVVISGCGTPITRSISVTRTAPATPGAITGPVNVCAFRGTNTTVTYSIAAVANASSYTWTLPTGVTLVSGSGTTSIQVLIGSAFCGGNITVRANSACGNSSTRCLALSVSTPSTPVSISGATTACPGNSQTYSVAAVSNATSYQWTVPTGTTITAGAGANSITLSFGSAFCGGTLSVRAVNGCGQSSTRSLSISRNTPATPGTISGPVSNLCGGGTRTYSIAAVSGATSYNWTVPAGASIATNNGTSITVSFGSSFTSGNITVAAVNGCGAGTARSISLSRLPATPASISGPTTVCRNQAGVVYSTPVVSGVTYTWTVPSGAVITSGQGTASITVKFGCVIGNVTVRANNGCGSSTTRSLSVCVASCRFGEPEPEEEITEAVSAFEFVVYPNPGIGRVNISMPELAEEIQLRVFAANGTLVRYEQIPAGTRNWTMQLEAEAEGVYMIQLETATQIKQLRYVKQ